MVAQGSILETGGNILRKEVVGVLLNQAWGHVRQVVGTEWCWPGSSRQHPVIRSQLKRG